MESIRVPFCFFFLAQHGSPPAAADSLRISSVLYPFSPSLWCLAILHGIYGAAYDLIGVGPIIVFATHLGRLKEALNLIGYLYCNVTKLWLFIVFFPDGS